MQKGMVLGQQYAMTKQACLEQKRQAISARYQAKATTPAAPAEAPAK
jgi:hypothetical protein